MAISEFYLYSVRAFSELQNGPLFMEIDQNNQLLRNATGISYCFLSVLMHVFTYFLKAFLLQSPQSPPPSFHIMGLICLPSENMGLSWHYKYQQAMIHIGEMREVFKCPRQ